jgi:cold shock CspA family protein
VQGRVVQFDEHRGLGELEAVAGGGRYPFHCTAIADGSRAIEVGAEVEFEVVAGRLGRWEAAAVRPAS